MNKATLFVSTMLFSISACSVNSGGASSIEDVTTEATSIDYSLYDRGTYTNPVSILSNGVVTNYGVADPSVVRGDDGLFYCFGTGGIMLQSEDACVWNVYKNPVVSRPSWGDGYYQNKTPMIWAPDVVKIKDKWIYYYALSAWDGPCGIGYAVADEITGEFVDMGRLFDSGEVGGEYSLGVNNAIDPQVFVDDDQKVYMVFGSFRGIYIVQLTDDGMGLYQGHSYQYQHKTLIAGAPTAWDGAQFEGSYIFKKDGYYYYMGSSGNCCNGVNSTYNVRVARSKNILGPYKDSDKKDLRLSQGTSTYGDMVVFSKGSNMNVKGPGHNSVLKDDAGEYWIYGHAYIAADNYGTRHLMMDKLLWDDHGMPYVEGYCFSYGEELDGPSILLEQSHEE